MKKISIIISVFAITFNSCKKPDTSALTPPGKKEYLTSKKWVLSDMHQISGGTETTVPLSSCEKDDYLLFDAYTNFKSDQGACVSNTMSPQTDIGNWQTTDNFTSISMYTSGSSNFYGTYIVNELTESSFIFTDNYGSVVTKYYFKAQ